LPIETSANGVKSFAELCGRIRNELSHFGGKINEPHRKKSLEEIISLSEALGYVYHASILMEIGVDREIIKAWFDGGLGSHERKCALVKVNLLEDKSEEEIRLLLEKVGALTEIADNTQFPECGLPLPETLHDHEQPGVRSSTKPTSLE
jgi:hypothetical protein